MTPSGEPRIGRYRLFEVLGRGGMAVVYRAVDAADGSPAAVKVLNPEAVARPVLVDAVRDEVRMAATLAHPHVVRLLDAGRVRSGNAAIPAGAPWVALELADGSLRGAALEGFEAVRAVLRAVLAGLAHAHAHGLVHRDVKPDNVLYVDQAGHRRWMLSDFGMAIDLADDRTTLAGGTPGYMAPEQRRGDVARQGPWTDLYGAGCVAWSLLHGAPPPAEGPPLAEAPAPGSLDLWLHRMLAPDPRNRYRHAIDALHDLDDLEPSAVVVHPVDRAGATPSSLAASTLFDWLERDVVVRAPAPDVPAPQPRAVWRAWRRLTHPPVAPRLGLFTLRPLPPVGRQGSQDALWGALERAHRGLGPVRVVLRGEAGLGKSALADWLCAVAAEAGIAEPFVARHSPLGSAREGLEGLVAAALRVPSRTDEAALRAHLEAIGADEVDALVELLIPDAPVVRLSRFEHRYGLVERTLRRLAGPRVALVRIDDAQWGGAALRFAATELHDLGPHGLVVVTAEDEVLPSRPWEAALLQELEGRAEVIRVGRLDETATAELAATVLPVSPGLARRIAANAGGSPLVVAALLGDWADQDALVAAPDGLVLAPEASDPTDLPTLWRRRLSSVLGSAPDPAGWTVAVRLGLLLGLQIDRSEWEAATAARGLPFPEELPHALGEAGLIRPVPGHAGSRWQVAHSTLADAVIHGLTDLPALHDACAAALEPQGVAAAARRARHLVAAGRCGEATDVFLTAIRDLLARDLPRARALVDQAEAALREGFGEVTEDVARMWVSRAHVDLLAGAHAEAAASIDHALAWARTHDAPALEGAACQRAADLASYEGRDADAGVLLQRALALGPADRFTWFQPDVVRVDLASRLADLGDHEGALALGQQVVDGDAPRSIRVYAAAYVAYSHLQLGRIGVARDLVTWALAQQAHLSGSVQSVLYQVGGLIAEAEDDLEDAERWARRAVDLRDTMGLASPAGELSLAELATRRGALEEARAWLDRTSSWPERYTLARLAIEAAIAAARGDAATAAQHLDAIEARQRDDHLLSERTRRTCAEALRQAGLDALVARFLHLTEP